MKLPLNNYCLPAARDPGVSGIDSHKPAYQYWPPKHAFADTGSRWWLG